MGIDELIRRLRSEFTAMPGLRLTEAQVRRLCSVDATTCASGLRALMHAGFLRSLANGTYVRSDLVSTSSETAMPSSRVGVPPPPWRRILALVDFESDTGKSLSAASHSVLRDAVTLSVTHRARITSLPVIQRVPQHLVFSAGEVKPGAGEQERLVKEMTARLRQSGFGEALHGLIDVHVSIGKPHDTLLRMAAELGADLIVLGQDDHTSMLSLSRLQDVLPQAPCPLLIVHPSGRAAVA